MHFLWRCRMFYSKIRIFHGHVGLPKAVDSHKITMGLFSYENLQESPYDFIWEWWRRSWRSRHITSWMSQNNSCNAFGKSIPERNWKKHHVHGLSPYPQNKIGFPLNLRSFKQIKSKPQWHRSVCSHWGVRALQTLASSSFPASGGGPGLLCCRETKMGQPDGEEPKN